MDGLRLAVHWFIAQHRVRRALLRVRGRIKEHQPETVQGRRGKANNATN